jgi:hypothetical protein
MAGAAAAASHGIFTELPLRPSSYTMPRIQRTLCSALALSFLSLASALAQEANVLGLPAVPQPKPGSAAAAGSPAAAKPAAAPASSPAIANRELLAGEVGIQHSALGGIGRIVLTTRTSFGTAGTAGNAIAAARLVQKELALACGQQCKPQKMAAPKILSSGQLEFELVFSPLHQHLNQAQFLAALQGKPLNLTAAQLTAPAAQAISPPAGAAQTPAPAGASTAPASGSATVK